MRLKYESIEKEGKIIDLITEGWDMLHCGIKCLPEHFISFHYCLDKLHPIELFCADFV